MFACTITPTTLNIFVNGRQFVIDKTHSNFEAVKKTIKAIQLTEGIKGDNSGLRQELLDLVDIKAFICRATEGKVQISDDEVRFDGMKVHGVIVERILQILHMGMDVRPMARFLERLKRNPDLTAIDEVYLFLESGNMPITVDGCFLAYKYVRDDYYSVHSGLGPNKVRNMIGDTPSMPRSDVCKDRSTTCAQGLHFCSHQYLREGYTPGDRIMILKIAPEDVVSIPNDYRNSKGRTWRYAVVAECAMEETGTLYNDKPIVASEGEYDDTEGADHEEHCCDTSHQEDEMPEAGPADEDALETACENTVALDAASAENLGTTELTFPLSKRKRITATELKQSVADWGQRGTARKLKIPRTTLQGWLKQIH